MDEDKKQIILQAATFLFLKKGIQGTKMVDIAVEAGIAKGTVYLYYKNKEELFRDVTKKMMDDFLDELAQKVGTGTVFERLLRITTYELKVARRNRQYARFFLTNPDLVKQYEVEIKDFMRRYTDFLSEVLGIGPAAERSKIMLAYQGMLQLFKWKTINDDVSDEEMQETARFIVKTFLHGVILQSQ
jgi:TetR/AcrR family transcriptional regulator, fatty acid metabolism regulator protein